MHIVRGEQFLLINVLELLMNENAFVDFLNEEDPIPHLEASSNRSIDTPFIGPGKKTGRPGYWENIRNSSKSYRALSSSIHSWLTTDVEKRVEREQE